MKKVFLTLAVVMMAMAANAQVWMGGSFGFNSTKADANAKPELSYSIAPEIGYHFAEKWDAAVGFGYSGSYYKEVVSIPFLGDFTNVLTESNFSVEPYIRCTIAKLGDVGFFVDGGVKYTTGTSKLTVNGEVQGNPAKLSTFWAGLQPGVCFAASDEITFAARIGSLGYMKNADGSTNIGVNVNNAAFTLGLWWTF